ncbi:uncharacterized protein PAC_12532 [Phialocephala subalpina]|uniref:Heterokaryon incompatibility domain-containing protein n=1 Tax=Phialocephala subalpina TaxID=576137 RepID=A0A1L7XC98_9HELO|nr:uncharacterized protein PAC_12532 [Phialocephala subalpina]
MSKDIPKSEAEARAHIAHIRKEKRLDGPDSNTSDLENALIILSEQLYQKSTHFLLELIQNADDNAYATSAPTLNITFSDRTLRIDCNELGFSKANTEAICKIGRSTKKGLDKATRYIGEKGIGFKSVFKIADVVWISSGHYSFNFDKQARLDDCDTGELLDDLRSMDPRLLIFLRKLRQLNITIRDKNGIKWCSKLGRQDLAPGKDGGNIISLNDNADAMSYKIITHSVTGLPEEPKRPGSSVSEILLAFPLDESNEPLISSQKVYAFLPIRDYGFKSQERSFQTRDRAAQRREMEICELGEDVFLRSDDAPTIPTGISIVEIDPHASSDLARRSLFILLGAQTFSNDMVCKAIASTHSSPSFRPNMLSRHDLISHVAFLYHARWKNSNDDFFWMATESRSNERSCEIYVDSEEHYSATDMFQHNRDQVSFIHEDYFKDIFTADENLRAWLVDSLHLAEYPRLVPDRAPKITMSEEFQLLLETTDYLSVLLLLKNQWENYHEYFSRDDDPAKEAAKARLRDRIEGMMVNCRGGETARLKETMLPLRDMAAENMTHLSFIDIPEPESRHWRFLSCFGVVVNAGAGPFIQCLQLLRESGGTLEQAAELYKQIFLHSNGHEGYIQKEFSVQGLIFAPRSANGSSRSDWINTGDCVWDGPGCLKKTPCIRDIYPDHGRFFCLTLGLRKANWLTLMNEAQSIEAFDDIDYISDVFISISEYLHGQHSKISAETMKDMITTLTESPIFPVRAGKSQALKAETIGKIGPLIATLGWEHRLLSQHVQGVPETGGRIQLTFEYTKSICAKARYIARLLPSELANRAQIIGQLCNAKVYTAEKVSIQWTLKTPDGSLEVVGRADSGRVKITPRHTNYEKNSVPFVVSRTPHMSHSFIGLSPSQTSRRSKPDKESRTGRKKGKRNYHSKPRRPPRGRKTQQGGKSSTLDVVQLFMDQFNRASSWSDIAAQPWDKIGADEMLSHLCRLENVDPYSLLSRDEIDSPWNKRLKAGGAFPDDAAGFFFKEDPVIHKKNRFLRPAQHFPASVKITRDKGIYVSISPNPIAEVGGEILLAGEVYISKMLEREMGSAYKPEVHWTSHFRNRSGLDPFTGNENESSTFTIEDDAGSAALTQLLLRHGYKKAGSWPTRKRPTYHIEASTTEEDILSEFTLESFQVQKATSDARYFAQFEKKPDFITLEAPGAIACSGANKSGKRISKLFPRKKGSPVQEVSSLDGFYTYKTLKIQEIRLLELFPGQGDAPVQGIVSHVPVDKAANFCAISYAWGPALKPYFLQTSEGKVPLTTSLHSALKRIRSIDTPIIIWADAICINQSNDYEKALQIRLLPTIFQSAEQVFAWIGDEDDNSHKAMETLMQIKANAISPDEWPDELPRISANWQDGLPLSRNSIWKDIASLFERAWFQRVWIIQEVVLAADVRFVCGAWDVDWDDIFSAVEICLDWTESLDFSETRVREMLLALKPAYAIGLTRKAFKEMKLSPPFKLIALLDSFAHTQSTKECDKLFALLGISSDAGIDAFDPDYHSPVESVVRRYAAEFVRRGSAIDILYRAGLSKSYDFSSWIPKWTSQEPCRTISTWRGANGIFSAGGSDETQAYILPHQPDKLHVAGTIIDQIAQIGTITTAEHDVISVIISIHKLIDELEDYPTGESKDEIRLKLPIGNAITPCADDIGAFQQESDLEDEETDRFDWNSAAFDVSSVADMVEFLKQNRDARDLSWRYWSTAAAFLKRLNNGRFSVTRRGYVGFAPNGAMVGDLVCVFGGGAVPFVVRPKKGEIHSLVGECYIHGIMYGESLELEGVKHTEFVLE